MSKNKTKIKELDLVRPKTQCVEIEYQCTRISDTVSIGQLRKTILILEKKETVAEHKKSLDKAWQRYQVAQSSKVKS